MSGDNEKYPRVRLLGTGSFGHVYLCKGEGGGDVVVKRAAVEGTRAMEVSATEVYMLKLLRHPNVLLYVDHYVDGESHLNIVTEFCEGGDLGGWILEKKEAGGSFTDPQLASLTFQIFSGVAYLHASEVIHRDIKPSNIFLSNTKIVKIGDFGISRMLSDKSMATTMAGTPFYISPEVCCNEPYTHPSDMWGVGCVIYELLTLNRPFSGPNILAIAQAVASCRYQPPPVSRLGAVAVSLLVKDPEQRPTAAKLLERYYSFKVGEPLRGVVRQKLHDGLSTSVSASARDF